MAIAPTITKPTASQRHTAEQWLVRQDSGCMSQADHDALRCWLEADPRHRQAFDDIQDFWRDLYGPARIVATRRGNRSRTLPALNWPRSCLRGAGWAIAASLVALATWTAWPGLGNAMQDLRADIRTPYGETREVSFPDGSTAILAANSALTLDFSTDSRSVTLLRGEAFFQVKPGLATPFMVTAGPAWIRVVGTGFDVHRLTDHVQVAVEHGIVDVGGQQQDGIRRLTAGQSTEVGSNWTGPTQSIDPSAIAPWRESRLVFYGETLSHVVERLEQMRPGRIVIATPSLATRKVSGAFPNADVDATLAAVADTFGARVSSITPWLTILY